MGVVRRVLVGEPDFFVAQIRFFERATIYEHPGESDTIVVCLEGRGFTSVGCEGSALQEVSRLGGRGESRTAPGPRTPA